MDTNKHIYDLNLRNWRTLDNAAKIFPAVIKKYSSTFFRLEVELKETVHANALQRALHDSLNRYSFFRTRLRKGFFWHFLEEWKHSEHIFPLKDSEPCKFVSLSGLQKNALWRVLAGAKVIVLEVSHLLTDGKGALEFFKTLVCQYYEYSHQKIKKWEDVNHTKETSAREEKEEGYLKHFVKNKDKTKREENSFHYPEKRGKTYHLARLLLQSKQVKELAKKHGVSVTSLLIAIHLYATCRLYKEARKKFLRVVVPVNLRQFFPTKTLLNFFVLLTVELSPVKNVRSLKQIVKTVSSQIKTQMSINNLQKKFSYYVMLEKNIFSRVVPRFIKTVALRNLQYVKGHKKVFTSFSNLGVVSLPKEVENIVENFGFFPPPSRDTGRNMTVISFKNTMVLGFGKHIKSYNLEREITKVLLEKNIDVVYIER